MRANDQELRDLFRRTRLTLSLDDLPTERVAIPADASGASLLAIANLAAERAVQLYAEKHPRPTQVTQTQAAVMLCVSSRTVRRYIRTGKLKLNRCGLVPIEAVDKIRSAD